MVEVGKGFLVSAAIVGATVLLLPEAVAGVAIGGLGILGAAGLGLSSGAAITGSTIDGKKLSGADRTRLTVGALVGWGTLGIASARTPYWRYIGPDSRPTYGANGQVLDKTWLTRGFRAPYSISEAGDRLQIPREVMNVEQVKVPFWRYIAGPRPATKYPKYGSGGGSEYRVGGWNGE